MTRQIMTHGNRGGLARGGLVAAVLLFATTGCTALVGGAAALGLVAVGALASRCYDYLDVTVLDAEGHKSCAATVIASKGKSQLELTSCYYTPLTDGRWTLRASLPGFVDAVSTVEVDHTHDCTRHVQTVELTLHRANTAPTAPRALLPPPAAVPLPAAPAASAASAASSAAPAASAPSAAESSAPAAAPNAASSSAPPANSAVPPAGVFPEQH
jgi:hypothetical protein